MNVRGVAQSLAVFAVVTLLAGSSRAAWDEKGAAELRGMTEKMFAAWEKGDGGAVKSMIASDMFWGAWDLDMMGKPISFATPDEVANMATMMAAEMKKMGATGKCTVKKIDCKASGDLGVCFAEADFTMTMPGMPPLTIAARGTDTARKGKDGWKFTHHHGSVAKAPDMPSKAMAWTSKTAPYQPTPIDGMKMATLWMDPATMSMVGVAKVEKDIKQGRHVHLAPMVYSVLEGKMSTTSPDGKMTEYGPGTVFYRAANEPHLTEIKAGTTVFLVATGPMQEVYVDDKGKPVN